MFHFNFDVDDPDFTFVDSDASAVPPPGQLFRNATPQEAFSEIGLESLLESLPTQLSYSFLTLASSSSDVPDLKLARRDLFDARFQLISDGTDDSDPAPSSHFASALEFIDNPSDLVPRVYEGGLKTWECSLDLAACLGRDGHTARGKRVLELGCGTAIPTLFILQQLFTSAPSTDTETHVHLQDYNPSVLHLVTLPNVFLAWYTAHHPDAGGDTLYVTPELVQAFKTALQTHRIHLRFFSGPWSTLDEVVRLAPYDIVLTSETMYDRDVLPTLASVLRGACVGHEHVCLVAGKTVYFGVGGGIVELERCVESIRGRAETIWETSTGVSRRVLRVRWM